MHPALKKMMLWPVYILPFVLVTCIACFLLEHFHLKGWPVVAVFAVGYSIFALVWFFVRQKTMSMRLLALGRLVNEGLTIHMEHFPMPYALVSAEGLFVWGNRAFHELLAKAQEDPLRENESIRRVFPELELLVDESAEIRRDYMKFHDRLYQLTMAKPRKELPLVALTFSDETEHLQTLAKIENEKNVTGLIYIDNYEEALKSTETVRQGLLTARIEQRIHKYFRRYDGIVNKTEKDRFSVSLMHQSMKKIEEDRFSLLDDVKGLNIGNTIPVTLSITFGADGESYAQNLELARTAMDLALGRGGDQAIVKTPAKVSYYGGKAIQQERQTRVKARVKAQSLRELMQTKDKVLIMGHKLGDNDSFGASVGIYRAAVSIGKKAPIVINDISSSVKPLWERFRASSEYPEDMFLSSEQALALAQSETQSDFLIVVVDVNKPGFTECPELLAKAGSIVVFDHHRQTDQVIDAVLSYVEPYASSASEMVAEILQYFSDSLKLRPMEAETLYSGIIVDTNNFTDRTGVRTFEAAAFLKRSGADLVRVKKIFREDIRAYRAKANTVSNVELVFDAFAFGICPAEGLESPTIIGAQAANELLNINGVKASLVFTKYKDTVYVSARSIDEVNVQLIMERLGGGGHLSIAGTQLKGCEVNDAKELVKETIKQMLEEGAI